MMHIPFLDLRKLNASFEPQLSQAVQTVLSSGWYLQGRAVADFERAWADYCGTKHAVAVGNGLDALTLALRALREMHRWKEGDEVLVPANTFIATILAVRQAGLTPVLCEPSPRTCLLETEGLATHLTPRTRAVLPVHLYGRLCDMETIMTFAEAHGLQVLEDAAQAHGATLHGRRAGHWGHASAFSFYPGKNLGALGDAGAVTTDDDRLARLVRMLGNYGSARKYVNELPGVNSRMDELQAAALSVKLPRLDADNEVRRRIARRYFAEVTNPQIQLPTVDDWTAHVFYVFAIRSARRDELQTYLHEQGIETLIHYPIPPHKQAAFPEWNTLSLPVTEQIHREILSLPISPLLTDEEVTHIIRSLNQFQ